LLVVSFAVGAASLWVPGSASAGKALFRVQRKAIGLPGTATIPVEPPLSLPAASASVGTTAPAAKFTLPKSFTGFVGTLTTNYFPSYLSKSYLSYALGEGRFRPKNPNGTSTTKLVVFPTVGGNPTPNYGTGEPVTPTTTFSGRYDFSRVGSIYIKPGGNRFGGTMRLIHGPNAGFYQYISVSTPFTTPFVSKAYGSFTAPPSADETDVGEISLSGMASRFRMTEPYHTKKAYVLTEPYQTKKAYIAGKAYYLNLVAPWTTGTVSAFDPVSYYYYGINPKYAGYDKVFASPGTTRTFTTGTVMQQLKGITRITSLVRPRLIHQYVNASDGTISQSFSGARLWTMRVFFLPEPSGMFLLGSGIAALGGLYLFRRR
jgi:hypothetical protein